MLIITGLSVKYSKQFHLCPLPGVHTGLSAHPQPPQALSMSGSPHETLGWWRDFDPSGSRIGLPIFPLGDSSCAKHENAPLPIGVCFVQKVVFAVIALLASNPPTRFSPINAVNVQALCNCPGFQQNPYFLLVCFALCVCMLQRDYCFHIYSKQQGCKLVLVTYWR